MTAMRVAFWRRPWRLAYALVPALAWWLIGIQGVAYAAGGTNLLTNGDFEAGGGSLTGWSATHARVSLATDGDGGGHAALASLKGKQGEYGLATSSNLQTNVPAAETFTANGRMRSATPGRSVCLLVREVTSAGALVQTAQQCGATTSAWSSFPSVSLTVSASGDSVSLAVQQPGGVSGDSFEADSLSMVNVDTTAPSAPSNVVATAPSSSEVDVSWAASADPDASGVNGYVVYRGSGQVARVGRSQTTYSDTSVSPNTTYSYTVAAFDFAGNLSAPSTPATVTTPAGSPPPSGTDDLWHMNETSGTTMVDSGLTPHNGVLHSVALGQPGDPLFVGTSYGFNGTSSYVSIPNSDDLNAYDADVRIALSLNTTTVPPQPDYDLFRKGVYPGNEYKLELQPNGQFSCEFRGSQANVTIQAGPDLHDGQWHRITCSKNATSMTVTIDGSTYTKTATIGSISNTYDMIIGAYPGSDYYQGRLDEVSFHIG
jgi:hypothetical protein